MRWCQILRSAVRPYPVATSDTSPARKNTISQTCRTADQTSGGLTASTLVTKPLTSAYTPPSAGQYWLAIVVVASQQPTLGGFGTPQGTSGFAVAPVSGTSTGSLTGPGTDNTTTYLAPQAATNPAYAYVS